MARQYRWCAGILAAVVIALGLLVGPALTADATGDAIDEARIKARAGKNKEAVADLDKLLEKSPDDPRIYYYKCKILVDLDRKNDAADSLEKAVEKMAKYQKGGGKDASILGVAANIEADAKDMLKYRREARIILQDYRAKSLVIAEKLLGDKKPEQALYVVDEVIAAVGADPEIETLLKKINAAIAEAAGDRK
ncbi:MAG: hypothetical protein IT462_13860 [Planctomycetes bacterium]|nr:hypothetical protein [Planctomycetota bacterium]